MAHILTPMLQMFSLHCDEERRSHDHKYDQALKRLVEEAAVLHSKGDSRELMFAVVEDRGFCIEFTFNAGITLKQLRKQVQALEMRFESLLMK